MLVFGAAVTGVAAVASTPVLPRAAVNPPRAKAGSPPPRTQVPMQRVSLFGDSLAYESASAFMVQLARRAGVASTVSTYPMTALCDFTSSIYRDLLVNRPGVLALEFSGNSGTPCMKDGAGALAVIGSDGWRDQYVDDLRDVLAVARVTRTTVVWATAPPVSPTQFDRNYPRTLAVAVRKLAATNDRLRVVDTGAMLTTDGRSFSRTLPCRPDERAVCRDGRLVVRSDDGLHFDCHGLPDLVGTCVGYSGGARRFGEAIADAAARAAGADF
jgi:hypothetical protein